MTIAKFFNSRKKGSYDLHKTSRKDSQAKANLLKKLRSLKDEQPSKGGLTPTKKELFAGRGRRQAESEDDKEDQLYNWNDSGPRQRRGGPNVLSPSSFYKEPEELSDYKAVGVTKHRLHFAVQDVDGNLKNPCKVYCGYGGKEVYELLAGFYHLMPIIYQELGPEDGDVKWFIEALDADKTAANAVGVSWFKDQCRTAVRLFYKRQNCDDADKWKHSTAGICVSTDEMKKLFKKLPGLFLLAFPEVPVTIKKVARFIAIKLQHELQVENGMAEVEMATKLVTKTPRFLEDSAREAIPDISADELKTVCRRLRTKERYFIKVLLGIRIVVLRQQQVEEASDYYSCLTNEARLLLEKAKENYDNDVKKHLRNGKAVPASDLGSKDNLYTGDSDFDESDAEQGEQSKVTSSSDSFLLSDVDGDTLSNISAQDLFDFGQPCEKGKNSSMECEVSTQDILQAEKDLEGMELHGLTQAMSPPPVDSEDSRMEVDTSTSLMSFVEGGGESRPGTGRKRRILSSPEEEEEDKETDKKNDDVVDDSDFDPEAETQPLLQPGSSVWKTDNIEKVKGAAKGRMTRRKAAERARMYLVDPQSEDDGSENEQFLGEEGRKKKQRKEAFAKLRKAQEAREKKNAASQFLRG